MYTYRLNIAVLGGFFLSQNIVNAQVVTDGTTGEGTALTGPNYEIGAELGTQAGDNLFHSFDQFSIETGGSATFSGPGNIENIISRVTGGEISAIDGLIASTIPGASLFLFNPAGVVFGPNASLDVTGSFHVSSADELRTADGGRFSAVNPEANGFSVAAPESFGFLGADPAGITIAGSELLVGEGETLSVVGGDVDISGANLVVEGGELNVLAVDGAAEANVVTGEFTGATEGDISVGGGSALASVGDGGGAIRIEGGAFVVDEASTIASLNTGSADGDIGISIDTGSTVITGGSNVVAVSQADGKGGDIDLNAESIEIAGGSNLGTNAEAEGRGGDTNLEAEAIRIADGSSIISRSSALGDGGDVNIQGETVTFDDVGSAQSFADAQGDGGAINIAADDVTVTGDGRLFSSAGSSGNGGNINISGDAVIFRDGAVALTATSSVGDGGAINVDADDVTLVAGRLLTSTTDTASGNGGDIDVSAGSLEILAAGPDQRSSIGTGTFGLGDAGDIAIRGGRLFADGANQTNGASIASLSERPGSRGGRIRLDLRELTLVRSGTIFADPSGDASGAASIDIVADRIDIDGAGGGGLTGISLAVDGTGDTPGTIAIRAGALDIQNGGVILSNTGGDADASDIVIVVDRLSMGGRGTDIIAQINSGAATGSGGNAGNITIVADIVDLEGDATIFSATRGSGDAGVIDITAREGLQLRDDSAINTSTLQESTGDAGSISINAGDLTIVDGGNIISSTLGSGDAGSIDITAGTALLDARNVESFGGITTQGGPGSTGNAGAITLAIDDLTLRNTSQVSSSAFGTGSAGAISITSKTIAIDALQADPNVLTGISTSVESGPAGSTGDAGAIVIVADQLTLRGDPAEIASANNGAGSAGTIDIRLTEGLVLDNGADIITLSESGGGGGISINADSYITATGPDSLIATTVADDAGDAGDILIETSVLGLGDARILAQADEGSGGDIQVTVDDLILSPAADINAEAGATGVDGTVAVSSPETDLTSGLVAFDGRFLDVSSLLRERCAARREDVSSSFTLGTGGAIPADLDAPRLSLLKARPKKALPDHPGQRTVLVLPCPQAAS